MSDLQLGLLAIGALVVAGVLAYNRLQERSARREAERSFRGAHADVLLDEAAPRREPVAVPAPDAGMPDESIDYVIDLTFREPAAASIFAEHWKAHEHRYAGRARLAASPEGTLRAGLQLVTRDGPVGEADLIEFRTAVESAAAAAGATVVAPEMKAAVESARALDRFCTEADVQVVFHVVPSSGGALPAERIRTIAEASGLVAEENGSFTRREDDGRVLFLLGRREGATGAWSVSLDVPRAPDTHRTYQAMAGFARQLAAALGGGLADDNGNALDERAVAAIGAQLDAVHAAFEARGLAPGSAQALRLFS